MGILKLVFATLRAQGYFCTAYIENSCLQGHSFEQCLDYINQTIQLMDSLGLTIHPDKSVLIPTQKITFVGFMICSVTMTIRLTKEKVDNIIQDCNLILSKKYITIRQFSKLIGKLVAAEPGVEHAPLYYKPLEKEKTKQLGFKKGNFDSFMKVSASTAEHISWWVKNLEYCAKAISQGKPSLVINSDASLIGYGATVIKGQNGVCSGVWSASEKELHINILELKACQYALYSFCKNKQNIHVRINMDNTTSCAYINKYGGKTKILNEIAREIWIWCIERNIFVSAAHIRGTDNCKADKLSRKFNDDLEWALEEKIFSEIQTIFGKLDIDMFASRLNKQLDRYVTRHPDPFAYAVDAFSMNWDSKLMYMFPPFRLINRVLQKLEEEEGEAVLVAPIWTTQSWWPKMLGMISRNGYILPPVSKILSLRHKPMAKHPLKKLRLGVFRLSGKRCNNKVFRETLLTLSSSHGENPLGNSMQCTSKNGSYFVTNGKLIQFKQMPTWC